MDQRWEQNFRTQMKRRREAAGESQSALAKRIAAKGLPFHQPTVQRIEDGERPVRLDEAFVIADVLGASVHMMTMSPDDEQVDATFTKGRLDEYANSIGQAMNPHWADHDDLADFIEQLSQAMSAAGGMQSPSTRWLGTWAIHGLAVARALAALNASTMRFHPDYEPDWEEGQDPFEGYPFQELVAIIEDPSWEQLPIEQQPKTLAQLPVSELDDMFVLGEGPFAAKDGSDDGEHQAEA